MAQTTMVTIHLGEQTSPSGPTEWEGAGEFLRLAGHVDIWLYTQDPKERAITGRYLRELKAVVDQTLVAFDQFEKEGAE